MFGRLKLQLSAGQTLGETELMEALSETELMEALGEAPTWRGGGRG